MNRILSKKKCMVRLNLDSIIKLWNVVSVWQVAENGLFEIVMHNKTMKKENGVSSYLMLNLNWPAVVIIQTSNRHSVQYIFVFIADFRLLVNSHWLSVDAIIGHLCDGKSPDGYSSVTFSIEQLVLNTVSRNRPYQNEMFCSGLTKNKQVVYLHSFLNHVIMLPVFCVPLFLLLWLKPLHTLPFKIWGRQDFWILWQGCIYLTKNIVKQKYFKILLQF